MHDDMCVIGTNFISVPYKGSITRYYGIIHVCNFFFNHNVYKIILHVFSSWVCDLLDIMKINLSNLSNLSTVVSFGEPANGRVALDVGYQNLILTGIGPSQSQYIFNITTL